MSGGTINEKDCAVHVVKLNGAAYAFKDERVVLQCLKMDRRASRTESTWFVIVVISFVIGLLFGKIL